MFRKVFVHSGPIHAKLDGLTFSLYSAEEIKKLSVVKIETPLSFNALGHPLAGGLYDPAMGPYDMGGFCTTCQQTFLFCPGHFGRIELPLPVINPLFSNTLLQLCRLSCLECHNMTVPGAIKHLSIVQMRLLDDGLLKEAQDAEFVVSDLLLDQETSGGKKVVGRQYADDGVAKMKFDGYLDEIYKGKEQKSRSFSKASSKNLENLKYAVLKRALSYAKMRQKCKVCGAVCKKLMMFESRIVYTMGGGSGNYPEETVEDLLSNETKPSRYGSTGPQKYLTPLEAKSHLRKLWDRDAEFLRSLFPVLTTTTSKYPTDLFFVEVIGVPPPKNRAAQMINSVMVENPQNLGLRQVVTSCSMLNYTNIGLNKGNLSDEATLALKGIKGNTLNEKLETIWNELQADVDHLMDRDKNKMGNLSTSKMIGLKQVIEKKEGLFRMHMMGKRVNYAARTVITPDPNLDTEEIGIPDIFAKVLTFPTPVTPWNVHMLKKMVLNGPNVYPGAVEVEGENGVVQRLNGNSFQQRQAIANRLLARDNVQTNSSSRGGVKIVYRHLMNGDYLLLNRQPSLHRPSIMAHRARVLYGDKVFRLHYANCKHYNADFDGDEMNAHFPQSHIGRSEAANLVNVCNHFLVPKDGTPLAGLIQDHIVAAVRMTVRGRFFSYRDYAQLVYFALSNYTKAIQTEPPTIIKPFPLWSGKQVISTIVKNLCPPGKALLTIKYNAKIKSDEWKRAPEHAAKAGGPIAKDDLSESVVIFTNGDLLCGVLDKVSLGATPFGLCHAFYEVYGNQSAGALLSAFSRIMTNFLQWEGFTLGVKDVLVTEKADKLRRQYMEEAASKVGHVAAALGSSLSPDALPDQIKEKLEQIHRSRDPKRRAFVDSCYKKQLDGYNNKINKVCLPHGLVDVFPNNNLQLLVQSGAKGSAVNTMQMSCALGQIELEGKRPPTTISGKTLPSFVAYDVSPRAGGFIAGRFLTGIRPQEFFFHCMAGREGLIDTAVKTSRSGYLQRCLCKLLEGVVVQYDGTVRDSDGSMIQYLYGEDGLDVGKSQYLKSKQLQFLEDNSASIIDPKSFKIIKELGDKKKITSAKKKITKWVKNNGPSTSKIRRGGFLKFCEEMSGSSTHLKGMNAETGRSNQTQHLLEMWRKLSRDEQIHFDATNRCPDPVISYLRPDSNFSAVSESLENLLNNMKKSNNLTKEFENVVHFKAMQSLSCPGDAVGILAAQSIGEPSTQMTLNTFHFAGRGEMNVTLGIPRLREILMVASAKIKTPSMDIPFLSEVSEKQAEKLKLQLTKVTMAQVLQRIEVREKIMADTKSRIHILKFVFLKPSEYSKNFCVKPKHILAYFESGFIRKNLCPALKKVNKRKKEEDIEVAREGDGKGGIADDDDGDNDDGDKGKPSHDAYKEREKKGTGEEHESSDEEEQMDDADATQASRRTRHTELEYEAPEDEEIIDIDEEDDENDDKKSKDGNESENDEDSHDRSRVSQADYDTRVGTVLAADELIQGYDFDQESERWCTLEIHMKLEGEKVNMASVLREVAEKAIIHQTPSINRAFIVHNGDTISLKTEGINILAMASYRHLLDIDRLHCNNIHTMAERYGIEAASRVIVKEMTDVFKVYGIVIDPRHLTLIADYMTYSGAYRPFNRIGIRSSASPLQQMSFETVVSFLRDATLTGKHDDLSSPSARLVVGKPTAVGTGLFGIRNQLKPFRVTS